MRDPRSSTIIFCHNSLRSSSRTILKTFCRGIIVNSVCSKITIRPRNQAHWWKATSAALFTWLQCCIKFKNISIIFFFVAGGGGLPEWAPALHLVEFRNVGVEIHPNRSILQVWVVFDQVPISIHKSLQHLMIYHLSRT